MSTHACARWHLSRDAKVVEKQRETPSVDRPPPALALSTTASKSVQVNGAASVRARRGWGCPGASRGVAMHGHSRPSAQGTRALGDNSS